MSGAEAQGSASPPWNFSWVVPDELAGMAMPETKENLRYLWQQGIRHLVTLSPERVPPIGESQLEWTLLPIEEFEAPTLNDMIAFNDICSRCIANNQGVGVHCRMGRGRTGVMAACYLVRFHGMYPQTAIQKVRSERPGSVETYEQERAVYRYHDYLRVVDDLVNLQPK
ncbi:hypothetical protein NQ318_018753 [Aromia moschata]|uniref:Dual specificity protein phosphatase 23 n=1 Tax=Aromia moschata TaxID=1265417 RepID=A0AAV8ZFU6_9CUCU|nr:hypothetical protein NQ318_018753 [Aromia moschata]